jgi:hypothetical protein
VAPDHLAELVGLALQRQLGALHLLVVLELELEQLHHLDRRPGGAGDGDARVAVGGEHLLHVAVRDEVAGGGPAVARHHHAVGEADGDHGGAVDGLERRGPGRGGREVGPGGRFSGAGEHAEEGRTGVVVGAEGGQRHVAEATG